MQQKMLASQLIKKAKSKGKLLSQKKKREKIVMEKQKTKKQKSANLSLEYRKALPIYLMLLLSFIL